MNQNNIGSVEPVGKIVVTLDCEAVRLPANRKSLASIRAFLEATAFSCQRVLGEFIVDGCAADLSQPLENLPFHRVDAITVPLAELPLVLLATAARQAQRTRAFVDSALTLVLINGPNTGREIWWNIASQLKEPVLTLSLMPENLCQLWCGTTFQKLRRWQLEQIAMIVCRVDEACDQQDTLVLSDTLEHLVLPWLDKLLEHIQLWQDATQAGVRLGMDYGPA